MAMTALRHRLVSGTVSALVALGAAAQGVPADEYPLPPAAGIHPIDAGLEPGTATKKTSLGALKDMEDARASLDELFRTYESGNIARLQQRLDPGMVGYQVFLNGIRRDIAAYRNLRINLTDVQVTAGPDLAVIQLAWEKRFLSASDFTPGIFTGRSTVLMHRDGDTWKLSAVALDNPFSSASGALARFTVTPMSLAIGVLDGDVPMQVEVVDPDMAGLEIVNVTVSTANGDRETLLVPSVSPGVFRLISVPLLFEPGTPGPGNLLVEVPGPGSITFRYVDTNPGDNRPASTLTRLLRVQ